ncbi:hypothetical protein NPIL_88871 [Nephila pilipes]|uniref:Uncharacterized protein n=1 Tax=Nephila pilipes TaxID=299642 RepID=A0A8X6N543_NEPPI|nr:hypothetical protein NPIL_88871 [Nephila pilipes]
MVVALSIKLYDMEKQCCPVKWFDYRASYVCYYQQKVCLDWISSQKGSYKKDILGYFSFRLNAATTFIYGMKQPRSRIFSFSSSDESTEDNESPTKRRIPLVYEMILQGRNI